jgi:dTDP-4-amino-4,6-dideoxygalactose transaminase
VFHLYIIRSERRHKLQAYLKHKGVGTLIHYPIPPHLQEAYRDLGYQKGDFPIAEELAATSLSLQIWPGLVKKEVERIVHLIKYFSSL